MKTTKETIRAPMLDGSAPSFDVLTFDCAGHRLSVRQVNPGLCYVMHRSTGLRITAEHTGDRQEAAEGFADAVAVGAYNLSQVASAAAAFPVLNP